MYDAMINKMIFILSVLPCALALAWGAGQSGYADRNSVEGFRISFSPSRSVVARSSLSLLAVSANVSMTGANEGSMDTTENVFEERHSDKLETVMVKDVDTPLHSYDAFPAGWEDVSASALMMLSMGLSMTVIDSVLAFLSGLIILCVTLPLLWLNERRSAKADCHLYNGQGACKVVQNQSARPDLRGELVHVSGLMRAQEPVFDSRFPDVQLKAGCVKLTVTVECFQWIQKKSVTTGKCTFTKDWSAAVHCSQDFENLLKVNWIVPGLKLGVSTTVCSRVNLGNGFVLPPALVEQCNDFQPCADHLEDTVVAEGGNIRFQRLRQRFYYRQGSPATPAAIAREPMIGDARVGFSYVPDGLATVLALQTELSANTDTFLPYRLIHQGFFSPNAEERRLQLLEEGSKSRQKVIAEDQRGYGFWWYLLCCLCNFVMRGFSSTARPEVFHIFQGIVHPDDCFNIAFKQSKRQICLFWLVRVMCWTTTFFGYLLVLLAGRDLITPNFNTWYTAFLATVFTALLVIAFGYFDFRPCCALLYILSAMVLVTVPTVLLYVL